MTFIFGMILGGIISTLTGMAIVHWHFTHRYFLVNEDKRDEYLDRFNLRKDQ